ncbi:MAG TPA: pyrimidine-nucleoside phosphorylase [Bacillota bacterium]|nr:pyrimidine-nucleoside phosphorylase [Bacillota bacterium]
MESMRAYDLIWKKREGGELTREEIHYLIRGFVAGEIPDYQMSAWCMAVYFQGMTFEECTYLTLEMASSGEMVDLSKIPGRKVDKHSTGGVGDKTSLVLIPLVAAAGIPVAKMSGRGLGHTGGTVDKLEAIPGFKTSLPHEEFLRQVAEIGVALVGQSGHMVPADKKLYALRDLTATIESIPLIASSIVSKKLAAGADGVLLDVKFGDGAFMRDYNQAVELARTMVEIGNRSGRRFKAVLSDMNEPLGRAIGNSLEVVEAIQTLQGEGPSDLTKLCVILGGYMAYLAERSASPEAGADLMKKMLESGAGAAKLKQLINAQGGDSRVVEEPGLLPLAPVIHPVFASKDGWVERIDCRALGICAMKLGAGRNKLEDIIKPDVGIKLAAKVGDYVRQGVVIAEVYARDQAGANETEAEVADCFHWSEKQVSPTALIRDII